MTKKICPILAKGWLMNSRMVITNPVDILSNLEHHLPMCLEGKCMAWDSSIPVTSSKKRCFLIDPKAKY